MNLLPFENIVYKSKLDSEEILKRISEIIEQKRGFRIKTLLSEGNYKPYEGIIIDNEFNLNRIIGYRNSFLPQIKGIVIRKLNRTTVKVKMRLHIIVIIFMTFWFGGLTIGFLYTLFNKNNNDPTDWIFLILILIGYFLVTAGFKFESKKSIDFFAKLLEAEID